MQNSVINVVIAGLGGQGVIKASDVLADAAFRAGLDVKKSEIHGMSQRGGSVSSDVRFGKGVLSPMVPVGEADFLVALDLTQVESNRHQLRPGGVLITPELIGDDVLENKKSLNIALLGALSKHLQFPESDWHAAVKASLPEKLHAVNIRAFAAGKAAVKR